ncbi:MAG: hypothetical protein LUO93_01090 [Methanomicrobiales archaeon]|nr:hypothetical protein [Methanomicrobiales archaeon]
MGDDTFAVETARLVGGQLLTQLLHPAITSFERDYLALPEVGLHDPGVSQERPVQLTLGSFEVPSGQALWLMDYGFGAFRFSGTDTGSMVPVEDRRLSGVMGFDLTVDSTHKGNVEFQLEPQDVATNQPQFQPAVFARSAAPGSVFAVTRTNSFASTSGQGRALLPPRMMPFGPANGPFTIVAIEGQRVAVKAVIFNPVPFPVAGIEGRIAGFLMGKNVSEALINRQRPR